MNSEPYGHGHRGRAGPLAPRPCSGLTRPPWDARLATVTPQAHTNTRGVCYAHLSVHTDGARSCTATPGWAPAAGTALSQEPTLRAAPPPPAVCLGSGFTTEAMCVSLPSPPQLSVTGALSSPRRTPAGLAGAGGGLSQILADPAKGTPLTRARRSCWTLSGSRPD